MFPFDDVIMFILMVVCRYVFSQILQGKLTSPEVVAGKVDKFYLILINTIKHVLRAYDFGCIPCLAEGLPANAVIYELSVITQH